MKTTSDIDSTPQGELVNANIPYVRGVIYETDHPEHKYVTPARTFNGWCADCHALQRVGKGFKPKHGWEYPVPILRSDLLEPVAAIIEEVEP